MLCGALRNRELAGVIDHIACYFLSPHGHTTSVFSRIEMWLCGTQGSWLVHCSRCGKIFPSYDICANLQDTSSYISDIYLVSGGIPLALLVAITTSQHITSSYPITTCYRVATCMILQVPYNKKPILN